MNSHKPFSCILPANIESASCVVSLVVLTVVEVHNVRHNN
jgi:hypothetical protein